MMGLRRAARKLVQTSQSVSHQLHFPTSEVSSINLNRGHKPLDALRSCCNFDTHFCTRV
jgi:hypothetical protein